MNFIITWFDTQNHINNFKTHLYTNYNVGDAGLSVADNEKKFLNGMIAYPVGGCGLKLFQGNSDLTHFFPIKLNSNNQVKPDPCITD